RGRRRFGVFFHRRGTILFSPYTRVRSPTREATSRGIVPPQQLYWGWSNFAPFARAVNDGTPVRKSNGTEHRLDEGRHFLEGATLDIPESNEGEAHNCTAERPLSRRAQDTRRNRFRAGNEYQDGFQTLEGSRLKALHILQPFRTLRRFRDRRPTS